MRYFLFLTLPFFLLDYLTKEWTVRRFIAPTEQADSINQVQIDVIPGFFTLNRVHNTGIFFGNFNGTNYANPIFIVVCTIALLGLAWFSRKGAFPTRAGKVAAALLVAGILGNLLDRILRHYVVDFLTFDLKFMKWPSFNVADACICTAAALLFITAFQTPAPTEEPVSNPPS